jgi:two-component system OmpR family response regulator
VAPLAVAFELTTLGKQELQQANTRANARELEMLVRFDGGLTLDQVRAGMEVSDDEFEESFRSLQRAGWIRPRESDRFGRELENQIAQLRASDEATAEAGEVALRRQGFFVQIARERAGRKRTPQGPLQAVIIEDEPVLARFTKTYLLLNGIESRIAGDRRAVVATLSSPPVPDVILLDVRLPDADGFHILSRLRAHAVLKQVPVIMLTADATRQSVIRGIAGGADGYVTKPFEAEALARAIRTCLGLGGDTGGAGDPWTNPDANARKRHNQGRG